MEVRFADEPQGKRCCLAGHLTYRDNEAYGRVLDALRASAGKAYVLDMAEVAYVDSFGIGLVVLTRDEAEKHDVALSIVNLKPAVRDLFDQLALVGELPLDGSGAGGTPVFSAGQGRLAIQRVPGVGVKLAGRFGMSEQGEFLPVIKQISEWGQGRFRIDLSEVGFIDSTGLSLLLAANDEARWAKVTLVLANPSPAVAHLLHLAAIDQVLAVESND